MTLLLEKTNHEKVECWFTCRTHFLLIVTVPYPEILPGATGARFLPNRIRAQCCIRSM
jgi:hypothetical protein